MERPTGLVPGQPAEIQRLSDYALTREGGVSMDENGQHGGAVDDIDHRPILCLVSGYLSGDLFARGTRHPF